MEKNSKIFVAGHNGMVGSAILRHLEASGYTNIIFRKKEELDLTNQNDIAEFFQSEKPEYVFLAAAKVGGILANDTFPAEFYYLNSMIQNNVIHNSYLTGVKKLLFLGSSCIYPRLCPQPMKEEYLLTGELEKTNEAYAIAKISGLKMCQYYNRQYGTNYISCMPTNLYGPNDNFDLKSSHVLPALIRRIHEAKESGAKTVEIWGTGKVFREFLHVDDLADATVFLMNHYNENEHINVGSGQEVTIADLARLINEIVGFDGELYFDTEKPDGTPRKLLDCSKLDNLGWRNKIDLREGIGDTYKWFLENKRA